MSRHRSLTLGFGACLALGFIDLVVLNVWLAPAAWRPSIEGRRATPSRAPDSGVLAAASPDSGTAVAAREAPDATVAASKTPDVAVAKPAPKPPRKVFRARRVFFATSSSELSARAVTKLARVIDALRRYPTLRVELHGHTDPRGRESFNDQLSSQRAEVVAAYLQQRGITRSRIRASGHGATKPLAKSGTPRALQLNRRVEIRIRKGTSKP